MKYGEFVSGDPQIFNLSHSILIVNITSWNHLGHGKLWEINNLINVDDSPKQTHV